MISTKILGIKELNRALDGLPPRISRGLRFNAMIRAAQPMKRSAVNFAPKRNSPKGGTLKKSITIWRNLGTAEGKEPTILLGPEKGKQAKYDAWYAHFQERGTKGFGKRRKFETWDKGMARTAAMNAGMSVYQRRVGRGAGRYIITTGYGRKSATGTGLPAIRFMQRAFEQNAENYHKSVKKELSTVVTNYLNQTVPKYAH